MHRMPSVDLPRFPLERPILQLKPSAVNSAFVEAQTGISLIISKEY